VFFIDVVLVIHNQPSLTLIRHRNVFSTSFFKLTSPPAFPSIAARSF
jgi:hypothetical protein